jgi:hypothetical protein
MMRDTASILYAGKNPAACQPTGEACVISWTGLPATHRPDNIYLQKNACQVDQIEKIGHLRFVATGSISPSPSPILALYYHNAEAFAAFLECPKVDYEWSSTVAVCACEYVVYSMLYCAVFYTKKRDSSMAE